jgi:AAA domain/RepB DNA-primase from phage plasmid
VSAFQTFQNFFHALYSPDEVVALMFSNPDSGKVQHAFVPASTVTTKEFFQKLQTLNETLDVYTAMNPFKPEMVGQKKGRTKENVAGVKRIYVDADKDGAAVCDMILANEPEPTVLVESSPGKYQFIWNVDDLEQATAEPLMRALAEKYHTDPAVAEVARVLRIPGFRNHKYIDSPEVKLVKVTGARYKRSAFHVDYKTEEPKGETVKQERPLIPHGSIHPWLANRAGKLRESGLMPEEIEPILLRMAYAECELPLDDNKIRQVARSMKNYEQGQDKSLLLTQGQDVAPVEITDELIDKEFPAYDGTQPDELPMLVSGFMPKGVGFLGSLSGVGKTWVALSIARALTSGLPLWGVFPVKQKTAVLYLIPEASDSSFKRRLATMQMTKDKTLFRFRTITQGQTRSLSDPLTIAAIQKMRAGSRDVLVIVDTAIRFFQGGDENAAKENNLVVDSDNLRAQGADVLFLHHSPKATKDAAELTLENVLRGSGDFGAMSDFVYGFRRDESMFAQGEGPEEVEVICVKPRDFEPPLPFRLQFKRRPKHGEGELMVSVIDETHDLRYIGNRDAKDNHAAMLSALFKDNPNISANDLAAALGMRKEHIKGFCRKNGWKQVEELVADAKGRMVKKRRWTNTLVMLHQVVVRDDEPEGVNTVAFGTGATGAPAPAAEDPSQGF